MAVAAFGTSCLQGRAPAALPRPGGVLTCSPRMARQTAAQVVAARAASKPKAQPKPTAPKTTAHGKRKRASDVGASAAKRTKTVPVQDTVQTTGAGATTRRVQPLQRQPLMETEALPSFADLMPEEEDEFGGALA